MPTVCRFQKQTVPVKQLYQRKGLCAIISAVPEVPEVFHNTKQVRMERQPYAVVGVASSRAVHQPHHELAMLLTLPRPAMLNSGRHASSRVQFIREVRVIDMVHECVQALSHFVPEKPSKSERRRSTALEQARAQRQLQVGLQKALWNDAKYATVRTLTPCDPRTDRHLL